MTSLSLYPNGTGMLKEGYAVKANQIKTNSGVNAQTQCAQAQRSDHGRRGSRQKDVGGGPAGA